MILCRKIKWSTELSFGATDYCENNIKICYSLATISFYYRVFSLVVLGFNSVVSLGFSLLPVYWSCLVSWLYAIVTEMHYCSYWFLLCTNVFMGFCTFSQLSSSLFISFSFIHAYLANLFEICNKMWSPRSEGRERKSEIK